MLHSSLMACSSPRTREEITRRAGIAGDTGCITTSNHGAGFLNGRLSRSWSTTIVHRGYRLSDSPGLRACGGGTIYAVRRFLSRMQSTNVYFVKNKSREI